MQIFVKLMNGKTLDLQVQPHYSILDIKKIIQNRTNLGGDNLMLLFQNKCVKDQLTLADLPIRKDQSMVFFCTSKIKGGGGMEVLKFNSLTGPIQVGFSREAPLWRIISKGLNLEGTCINNKCKAFSKKVWIKKGFGIFFMNKQVQMSKCPMCNIFAAKVDNLGIYNCSAKVDGKMVQNNQIFSKVYSHHSSSEGFLTFEDKDQTKREWKYLQLEVRQLFWIFD